VEFGFANSLIHLAVQLEEQVGVAVTILQNIGGMIFLHCLE